ESYLKNVRVVVFLNTTLDVLGEPGQSALTSFIQAGGGFVGIHSAADTEYDWPWYGQMVGAYFDGHPNNPNVREGVLHVNDSTHVSTKCLPHPWTRTDEWYDYRYVNPSVQVLLLADDNSYKRPEENASGGPHPIAWYHEFDGGRVFYTGLGHTSESFEEPLYLEHLWGGMLYALGETTSPE
ncbi:MAG: ThuA domain-containing protein, partial [Rhodothermales bacterium]|nr:ThuA domain-containing protein [Rhodothermales bacterium]